MRRLAGKRLRGGFFNYDSCWHQSRGSGGLKLPKIHFEDAYALTLQNFLVGVCLLRVLRSGDLESILPQSEINHYRFKMRLILSYRFLGRSERPRDGMIFTILQVLTVLTRQAKPVVGECSDIRR